MKMLAVWALACLAPSCGGTSTVLFTGKDTAASDGKLGIISPDKSKTWATVCRLDHLLNLDLPYAEDWKAESSPERLIFASSATAEVVATVQVFKPEKPVNDELYLRVEVLNAVREGFEKRGGRFKEIATTKHKSGPYDTVLLEYLSELPLEDGTVLRQAHFWSVRQRNTSLYRVHLSTSCMTEPKRSELLGMLRDAAARRFIVLPIPTK
jgi:hypothetical protein